MTPAERQRRRRAKLTAARTVRRHERDQKRRTRAAERDQADAERPPAPPIPDSLAEYLAGLEVTQGEHEGELLTVLEWQREFLERVDGLPGGELGLSVGAGAGKTTLVAGIAAAGVAGPLARRRAAVLTVAGSFSQACLIFDTALAFLRPWIDADPDRWRVLRSEHTALIQDRETGAELRGAGGERADVARIRASPGARGRTRPVDAIAGGQAVQRATQPARQDSGRAAARHRGPDRQPPITGSSGCCAGAGSRTRLTRTRIRSTRRRGPRLTRRWHTSLRCGRPTSARPRRRGRTPR